jgi:hypothetical protein
VDDRDNYLYVIEEVLILLVSKYRSSSFAIFALGRNYSDQRLEDCCDGFIEKPLEGEILKELLGERLYDTPNMSVI